jgi:hypothetical protein
MISSVLPWYKMVHRTSWLPQNVGWSCTQEIKFLLCTVYTFRWETRARFGDIPIFVLYFYDSVYLPQPGSFSTHSYFLGATRQLFRCMLLFHPVYWLSVDHLCVFVTSPIMCLILIHWSCPVSSCSLNRENCDSPLCVSLHKTTNSVLQELELELELSFGSWPGSDKI